jgi:hypothetical protein
MTDPEKEPEIKTMKPGMGIVAGVAIGIQKRLYLRIPRLFAP